MLASFYLNQNTWCVSVHPVILFSHFIPFRCSNYISFLFQIVLDSDYPLFGGYKRLDHNAEYFSLVRKSPVDNSSPALAPYFMVNYRVLNAMVLVQEGWYDDRPHSFLVYAPSRTAVVYALADEEEQPLNV